MDNLRTYSDERGTLTVVEGGKDLPFDIARVYWIYGVEQGQQRGGHANVSSQQFLVAVSGSVDVCIENADGKKTYHLDSKSKGLLIPPMTWNVLSGFSDDAVLLVLSSQTYRPETYLNDYYEFKELIKSR